MEKSLSVLNFHSDYIVRFVDDHPIDWSDRDLACRGGAGDSAGIPPVSSVEMFLGLLRENHKLFDQCQFFAHCRASWGSWFEGLPTIQKRGLEAKAFRNFYPSMIDSLHSCSLLSESGRVDYCLMNSTDDVLCKIDLTVHSGGRGVYVELIGPTERARECRAYKKNHRGAGTDSGVCVQLPWGRRIRRPSNKRWYEMSDFDPVMELLEGRTEF